MRFTYLALALLGLVVVAKAVPFGPKPLPADVSGGTEGGPDVSGGTASGPDERGMPDGDPSNGIEEAGDDVTGGKDEENPHPIEELRPQDGGNPEENQDMGENSDLMFKNTMAPAPEGEASYADQPQEPEGRPEGRIFCRL